ncbi:MAG: endonuclease/exonuclease/phosphatase family protein [Aureliella sp.]
MARVIDPRPVYFDAIMNYQLKFFLLTALSAAMLFATSSVAQEAKWKPDRTDGALRIATYNVSMNRNSAGKLRADLENDDKQIWQVAAVVRAIRPDILLLNEVDFDGQQPSTAQLFASQYLASKEQDLLGGEAWEMPYVFVAPVNTGEPSGLDINQNGKLEEPDDCWGYGRFPGQYGMAVLSRLPIDSKNARVIQDVLWSSMPGAKRPEHEGESFYPDAVWKKLRLPSKSFWDVPVQTPLGVIHAIASHPTPPAFDGPEDRNGCRNHDEIRLISEYIRGADFLRNSGVASGLDEGDRFVVLGDLNSDPADGGSQAAAIEDLLNSPRLAHFDVPTSSGGESAAKRQGKINAKHRGDSAADTADFNDRSVGNLRVDYSLPSANLQVVRSGVFWPDLSEVAPEMRQAMLGVLRASDHHLVWVDVVAK